MATLYVMMGLPGSGKSTWGKSHPGFGYHGSDAIREELYGDESIQGDNREIFGLLVKRCKSDLKHGISCVYDATNVSKREREFILWRFHKIHCRKILVVMMTPENICWERNKKRSRTCPRFAFDRFCRRWEDPVMEEGWDEIRYIV